MKANALETVTAPLPHKEGAGESPLLSTAYFPPVQWFTKLLEGRIFVEACETFHKQTYRNRCLIDSPQGALALTVPVVHEQTDIRHLRLSDHGHWRRQHWQALTSSYMNSPFFEFYEDDFRPFFTDEWEFLFDFNAAIVRKVCELIDLDAQMLPTLTYEKEAANDLRDLISPKHSWQADAQFHPQPYYQVFAPQHGFLPNLSIADLLFNMGPETLLVLHRCRSDIL